MPGFSIGSLLVPPLCSACGAHSPGASPICSGCRFALDSEPPVPGSLPGGLTAVASAYRHEGVARHLLNAFKFRSGAALAPYLASLMFERCEPGAVSGTLVSVPASVTGRARRGFDPAALLAAELAKLMPGLDTAPGLLAGRPGRRQLGRTRQERLTRARAVLATREMRGPVLLVDDVLTTGATVSSAARALKEAGAAEVAAITFTRRT